MGSIRRFQTIFSIFKCFYLFFRANSLKRAIRRLVEHTELAVDEQNSSASDRQQGKTPNITITCDDGFTETKKYGKGIR